MRADRQTGRQTDRRAHIPHSFLHLASSRTPVHISHPSPSPVLYAGWNGPQQAGHPVCDAASIRQVKKSTTCACRSRHTFIAHACTGAPRQTIPILVQPIQPLFALISLRPHLRSRVKLEGQNKGMYPLLKEEELEIMVQ